MAEVTHTKICDTGLINRVITFEVVQPMWSAYIDVTSDGRTDIIRRRYPPMQCMARVKNWLKRQWSTMARR